MPSEVKMPVVAYLRASANGEPQWSEDCVCEDPVYPADPDGSDADCISMPLVRQSDALAYAEASVREAEVAAERVAASLRLQVSRLTDRLDSKNAELRAIRALAQETKNG